MYARFARVDLTTILLSVPAVLFSLCFHEYGHARMATWLGDTTPIRQGRLTLSPASHVDPFGTILFPGMAIVLSAVYGRHVPMLGWAKPVQFVPANFTRKVTLWQGAALCALAGPGANFLLGLISALVLRVMLTAAPDAVFFATRVGAPHSPLGFAVGFAVVMMDVNVTLAFFNLFPMPPLDGGYLIPRSQENVRDFLARYSFILFLVLFFVRIPGLGDTLGWMVLRPPIELVLGWLGVVAGVYG